MPKTPHYRGAPDLARAPEPQQTPNTPALDLPPLLTKEGDLNPDFIDNLHLRMARAQERNMAELERAQDCVAGDPVTDLMRHIELLKRLIALRRAMREERLMWRRMRRKRKR